jgi:hypothetical protein
VARALGGTWRTLPTALEPGSGAGERAVNPVVRSS